MTTAQIFHTDVSEILEIDRPCPHCTEKDLILESFTAFFSVRILCLACTAQSLINSLEVPTHA